MRITITTQRSQDECLLLFSAAFCYTAINTHLTVLSSNLALALQGLSVVDCDSSGVHYQ